MRRNLLMAAVAVAVLAASSNLNAQAFSCPTHSPQQAAMIVKGIYQKVLEREADDGGLVLFSGKISGGGWCVQEVVRAIGVSPEYADRFIKNQTPRQAVVLMYRHFLLRQPESQPVIDHHVNELNGKGWQAKVLDFVNSPEAQKTWGNFPPSSVAAQFEASTARSQFAASGCKPFLGRQGNYLCTTTAGYSLCEAQRKDPANGITACQLSGVIPEADKALTALGCTRNAAGDYMCMKQAAIEACEAFKKENKVKMCRRTPIKVGADQ